VKNKKSYEKSVKADWDAVKEGLKKAKCLAVKTKKMPTLTKTSKNKKA
jgi:hypothetical protein